MRYVVFFPRLWPTYSGPLATFYNNASKLTTIDERARDSATFGTNGCPSRLTTIDELARDSALFGTNGCKGAVS
jgi:hypothetical protein